MGWLPIRCEKRINARRKEVGLNRTRKRRRRRGHGNGRRQDQAAQGEGRTGSHHKEMTNTRRKEASLGSMRTRQYNSNRRRQGRKA